MTSGRLKVLHVITRLIVGGAQENTLASVLGLRNDPGFDLHLAAGPTTGPEGSLEPRIAPIPNLLTRIPSLIRPLHPWHDALALRQLLRLFQKHQPDIVHTHSGKAGFLGRIAARRTRVPYVVHTIHGPSFGPFQGSLANLLFRSAERWAGAYTHHFVAVAQAMADQYLAAGIGRPHQYTRILSGFPLEPFLQATPDPDLRARLNIQPGDLVLGMIARLFPLKGHDDLLDIAPTLLRRVPQLRFLLVGDGAWRLRLEHKATQLQIRDRVIFTGLIPPEAIPAYVVLMDMLAHLSRREGLPRALPQALAAGRPVVAYDCDGAREVCRSEDTGFLVPPGDQAALVAAVLRLAENPSLRQRLGQRGQALTRQLFPVEVMVRSLAALYRRLYADPFAIGPSPDTTSPTHRPAQPQPLP